MKSISFEGTAHTFPDDFTDADISTALASYAPQGNAITRGYQDYFAKPVTKAVSRVADVLTEPLVASERAAMGEPRGQILQSYTSGPGIEDMNRRSAGATNPVASVVPQDPVTAGAMAATTLVAPWLTPLVRSVPYLGTAMNAARGAGGRILTGAVGGEGVNQLEGGTTGTGALIGGGGALVGEVGGAATSKLYRSTDMGRRQIARDDAVNVGSAMDAGAPTLKPGTTAPAMQRTAEGQGLARIGAAKEGVVTDLEAQLAAVPAQTPHFVDAQGQGWVRGAQPGQWQQARAQGAIPMPSLGKPSMTIREANEELSAIGDMMRGIRELDPRYKDVDLKEKYGEVARGIKDGIASVLGPDAAAQWASGQGQYRAGRFIGDDMVGRTSLFRQGEFNVSDLQRWLKNPDNRASLAKATGGDLGTGTNLDAYTRIVNAVERGAAPGMVDRMAGEAPGLMSGRGSYGVAALPMRLANYLLPNFSSRYVGNVSQQMPPALQAIIDVGLQRAGGAALRGDR